MRHKETGFSLIELLVVVAIILIIAAISLPNLLRSRMAANEAAAVNSLRIVVQCAVLYHASSPNVGYPNQAKEMGPVSLGGNNCLDAVLAAALTGGSPKSGYVFTYAPSNSSGGQNFGFTLNADPSACGRTGMRTFFADQTGVIRFVHDVPGGCPAANATSPIVQ